MPLLNQKSIRNVELIHGEPIQLGSAHASFTWEDLLSEENLPKVRKLLRKLHPERWRNYTGSWPYKTWG